MKGYTWTSRKGIKTRIYLSPNFDNILERCEDGKSLGRVYFMDCGIETRMPKIMRYCLENNVNLRSRKFLRTLPQSSAYELINIPLVEVDFKIPLSTRGNAPVQSIERRLVLRSSIIEGEVRFNSEEIPQLVEGILRSLNNEGVRLAQMRCSQIVQYYYQFLETNKF